MLEWISLRGCGITIAEEVQNLTRQGSEQPDVMVRFAFLEQEAGLENLQRSISASIIL